MNVEVLRTPDDRFRDLPGFPWPARWASTSDGLRLGLLDEGPREAPVVLLLHGEPTWGYLYRRVVPPLLEAGLRVVAPDLVGFGRSDKPAQVADHTYARHVEWLRSALLDDLALRDVTLFGQDWGGLLGLRLVAEHPERFARVAVGNTGLPDGSVAMGEAWQRFKAFVDGTPDLPIGFLVTAGCAQPLDPAAAAAYDAPFPDATYQAGPRALPGLIPQSPDDPAAAANRAAWEALERWDRPFLCLFSDSDPITAGADRPFLARVPGTAGQPHAVVRGAGHFLQEDRGAELAALLRDWVGR